MAQDTVPPLPKSSSNTKGCLIGCAIVFIVGALGTVLIAFAGYKFATGTLDAMTESEPRPVPEVTMTEDESAAAKEKLGTFMAAVKSGESEEKIFTFTGQELNVLLRSNEDTAILGNSVYLTIKDGEVEGEVSLDLGNFIPFLEGRYANGAATFSISASDGRLFVFVEDFRVKGEEASEQLVEQVRQQNLAEESMKNPEFQAIMENVESVAVEGDQLVVTLK